MPDKTTLSVSEMGSLLGLKKTEAYHLVHKELFNTVLINGHIRIPIDSFEHWYDNQVKYHKADGTEPGKNIREMSYSVREFAALLGIHESSAYALIQKKQIETFLADGWMRISKEEFDRWYASQSRFRTEQDKERDKDLEDSSLTLPEMADLLGISRNKVYRILERDTDILQTITVGGRKRVTRNSFELWYAGQNEYRKLSDRSAEEVKEIRLKKKKKSVPRLAVDPDKPSYSVKETAVLLDIPEQDVYLLIRNGDLTAKRYGRILRILRDDIQWFLVQLRMHAESDE